MKSPAEIEGDWNETKGKGFLHLDGMIYGSVVLHVFKVRTGLESVEDIERNEMES